MIHDMIMGDAMRLSEVVNARAVLSSEVQLEGAIDLGGRSGTLAF